MKQHINKVFYFNDYKNRNIVRIFPIEDYKKMDKLDRLQLGVIYINDGEKTLLENKDELFTTIPERTNSQVYEIDEDIKKRKEEIELKFKEMLTDKENKK